MEQESKAYLTFALGDEKFAINVDHVQEIVELDQFTKVPHAPAYMLGIINLRGRVLPLLDTRRKLGLPAVETTKKSRVMILDIALGADKSLQIGALVDVAKEVMEIKDGEILETPDFENYNAGAPITGIINNQGDITMVMDIVKVFSATDIIQLHKSLN